MNRRPSKPAVLLVSLFVLLAGGAMGWGWYQNHVYFHELNLYVLQARAERNLPASGTNAIATLDEYQQALEHETRPGAGIPVDQELMHIHARKACIYRKIADEVDYLKERDAIKQIMLHNPSTTIQANPATVDKAVDAMLRATDHLLNGNSADPSPASPRP
jgi:hypothetical protein